MIVRAFSPAIAILASPEADDFARQKGFQNGFREMLRPFGENVQGKVVIRDSHGASRAWDDFGVRFVDLVDGAGLNAEAGPQIASFRKIEELLEAYMVDSEERYTSPGPTANGSRARDTSRLSSAYSLFLRRLLSAASATPHESFLHPVACVIAISSQTPSPIETLRQLYTQSSQGLKAAPPWINPEYLRYYVLIHDEEEDDSTNATALFDQMKRHFGLHCHLLRLRRAHAFSSDDTSVNVETCEWISPLEDWSRRTGTDNLIDIEASTPCVFESDVAAINSLVRELVSQSVVPHMENRIAVWNDQIASRRRGISGRFMNMSKRWTGFATGGKNSVSLTGSTGGSSGNYDALQGFYRFDAPEAILRKMADYSVMLRDYRLAATTYELLRSDFNNDKAWRYQAGANEMCVVSTLLNPLTTAAKLKVDSLDQMMEVATYSYLTRCSDPLSALRCITLNIELLKVRGKAAAEIASKWGIRILELGLVGQTGHALVSERIADCFAGESGLGNSGWGARKRKAALWYIFAADEWLHLEQVVQAATCLERADAMHSGLSTNTDFESFADMRGFLEELRMAVKMGTANLQGTPMPDDAQPEPDVTEETSETLDQHTRRRSILVPMEPLGGAPLSPLRATNSSVLHDDDFQ